MSGFDGLTMSGLMRLTVSGEIPLVLGLSKGEQRQGDN